MKWNMYLLAFVVFFCLVGFTGSSVISAENEKKPQQFKVTYTVIYNSISLADAAKLEAQVIKEHADSCDISVELSGLSDTTNLVIGGYTFGDNIIAWD